MRLIFYIIIAYIIYKVAKKFLLSSNGFAKRPGSMPGDGNGKEDGVGSAQAEETVLDTVCGSYLSKELALKVNKDGKTHYFCGEECRDKFSSDSGAQSS